jgi:hypothetical protein
MKSLSKKVIFKFIKRLLISNKESKRIANDFVIKYYKAHKNEKINYVRNYWGNNKYWDFFFHSLPHVKPSNKFIPRDYYAIVVESALQNSRFGDFATEKNYYDKIFAGHGVLLPKTYYKVIDGVLFDEDFKRTSIKGIHDSLNNQLVVIKGTLTSSGTGVKKFTLQDGFYCSQKEKLEYNDIVKLFDGNLICQEVVKQHPFLESYHPSSLNTLRLFTYRSIKTNQVHITLSMLRMGIKGSFLDNVSAGGIACGIGLETGLLMKYAFDKYGNSWTEHPDTGVKFENQPIPYYKLIEQKVKELADVLAHSRLIGWDVSINENGQVILIEPNIGVGTWMMQAASGTPTFGDFSDEVHEYILKSKRN